MTGNDKKKGIWGAMKDTASSAMNIINSAVQAGAPKTELDQICEHLDNLHATVVAVAYNKDVPADFNRNDAVNMAKELKDLSNKYKEIAKTDNSGTQQMAVIDKTEKIINRYATKQVTAPGIWNQIKEALNNFFKWSLPIAKNTVANEEMNAVTKENKFQEYKNAMTALKGKAETAAKGEAMMGRIPDNETTANTNTGPKR